MSTELDGSFDERWRRSILRVDLDELRERVDRMTLWARARLDQADRELASRDLANPTPADLVHMTERTALIAVLTQLAGDAVPKMDEARGGEAPR